MKVTLPRAWLPVFQRKSSENIIVPGGLGVGLAFLLVLAFCAGPICTGFPAVVLRQDPVIESSVAGALTVRPHMDLAALKARYLSTLNVRYRPATRTLLNGQLVTNSLSLAARGAPPVSNGNRLPLAVSSNPPQFVYLC
jgi:hypothetical protein